MRNLKRTLRSAILSSVGSLLIWGCTQTTTTPEEAAAPPDPEPVAETGAAEPTATASETAGAPDFTLTDLDGQSVTLSSLRGKVVYLDFWATWCPPCREALPHTQELAQRPEAEKGELVVLAINVAEDKQAVSDFLQANNFDFRVPLDTDGAVSDQYKVEGIPTFVVIGRDGEIRWTDAGFGPGTGETITQQVDSALAET